MPGLLMSEHLSTVCPIDLETVPFWVQPALHLRGLSSGFGWLCITTPQRTFNFVHSRFPDQSGRPVRPSWLFFPLSTHAYQTHAEGRGCLPFTGEAGVVPPNGGLLRYRPPFTVSLTCMDMQLRKSNDLRRPAPAFSGSFGRTGRTHGVHADGWILTVKMSWF
jgi:hypothetical protein